MTELQRGTVVTRGGERGIVWTAWPDRLVLLPIVEGPGPYYATDVAIAELPDRMACLTKGEAVIRAGKPYSVTRAGQVPVGELSPACLEQVKVAHLRAQLEVVILDKWQGERARHLAAR